MAEWQTIATMNCYYAAANADFEACSPAFTSLLDIDQDLKYYPEMATNVPRSPTVTSSSSTRARWTSRGSSRKA